jgi:2-oxoglutarate dehydrogenase E1 component
VQESLNLSDLAGYRVGGAVHVVVNNQIGFTTEPAEGRSTQYATDVARMLQIPIFHVNGERPEAVDRVIRLALDFWQRFRRDVIVDMYCFRRHGHMEQDDPGFTQPRLYQSIAERPPIRETYGQNLVRLGQVTDEEARHSAAASRAALESELQQVQAATFAEAPPVADDTGASATTIPELDALLLRLADVPDDFELRPKLRSSLERRRKMAAGKAKVDWGTAELLAYAWLLEAGHPVRLSGQDSARGTFAHRHAVLHDALGEQRHVPLQALSETQAPFAIHNSPLSEAAVLAFEFGYSLDRPDALVVWEAQFGDFANVAQAVIDQFVVSSETKWQQRSRLSLLLPHGLEGQGPEHSSARLERFLQLCAEGNIEVAQPTSASQLFHRLRAQATCAPPRPLVMLTPKGLLQHPSTSSPLDELVHGSFEPLQASLPEGRCDELLLCSGPLALDLERERRKRNAAVAIVRLEQMYPLPEPELAALFDGLPDDVSATWVQAEPENMGAWRWLRPSIERLCGPRKLRHVSRPERASPATGSRAVHLREHARLLERVFEH